MRIADQVDAWTARNLQKAHKLKQFPPFSWLALVLLVGLSAVPAAAQSYAYVPTHKSNSVSVINTASNSVVAVVSVGVQPLQAAVSPDGAFAYVTNSGWFLGNNDVSVISTATNSVVATIPVGRFPVGVAFTPNGALAYVANQNSNDVSVINTVTQTTVATERGVRIRDKSGHERRIGDRHRIEHRGGYHSRRKQPGWLGHHAKRGVRLRSKLFVVESLGDQHSHEHCCGDGFDAGLSHCHRHHSGRRIRLCGHERE